MALINCPECGKEISDTTKVCIHCGYRLKQKRKEPKEDRKENKINIRKFIGIAGGILLAVGLVFGGVIGFNTFYITADRAYDSFKIDNLNTYNFIKGMLNEQEVEELDNCFNQYADEVFKNYTNGATEYETAVAEINKALSVHNTPKLDKALEQIELWKNSKLLYDNAVSLESEDNLEEAYRNYVQVDSSFEQFADAGKKAGDIRAKLINDYILLLKTKILYNKQAEANEIIKNASELFTDIHELTEIMEKSKIPDPRKEFEKAFRDCPLTISNSFLDFNAIDNPTVSVSVINNSDKTVDAFTVNFYLYDNFNKRVNHYLYQNNTYTGISQDIIKPGYELDGSNYSWTPYGFENTTKFIAVITEIHYTDNTTWKMNDAAVEFGQLYADANIESITFQ